MKHEEVLKISFGAFNLLAFLSLISSAILSSPPTSAEISATASANAVITVPEACTFTGALDTPHSAEVPAGTIKGDIGVTTFKTVSYKN